MWMALSHELASWTERKGEREMSSGILLSLPPDCECPVTSCLIHHAFPYAMQWAVLKNYEQNQTHYSSTCFF